MRHTIPGTQLFQKEGGRRGRGYRRLKDKYDEASQMLSKQVEDSESHSAGGNNSVLTTCVNACFAQ